jgi:hypothetical protein
VRVVRVVRIVRVVPAMVAVRVFHSRFTRAPNAGRRPEARSGASGEMPPL